jgi:DUF1009 family protein
MAAGRHDEVIADAGVIGVKEPPGRAMIDQALQISSPVGLIAAGGVMPFAVADSLTARGIDAVVFALKGACDPVAVSAFAITGFRSAKSAER